jgi:hypothetical protein
MRWDVFSGGRRRGLKSQALVSFTFDVARETTRNCLRL